jgi:deazaflavin-dependent oxidoreductase (nitroreductase family)
LPDFHARAWRLGNAFVGVLARIGVGPIQLLTTRGRKTGLPHTNPVVPVEHDGKCWLVAPYGPVSWVYNVRASGRARLRYGRGTRECAVREAAAQEAGPVLKCYVAIASKARSRFSASPDAPVEDFVAEAARHPVFEVMPIGDDVGSLPEPAEGRRPTLLWVAVAAVAGLAMALLVGRCRTATARVRSSGPSHRVGKSSDR